MTDVLGARSCSFWPVSIDVTGMVKRINAELANPGAFVYAFVDSSSSWMAAKGGNLGALLGAPTRQEAYVGKPPTIGTHIVVITGPLTEHLSDVEIPVWSWGTSFTARIPKQHLSGYLVGYSLGHF